MESVTIGMNASGQQTTRFRPALAGGRLVIALIVFAIAAAVLVLLMRPRLGDVDEANRGRHPSGFSMVAPLGWKMEPVKFRTEDGRLLDTLRFAPERKIGRQPWLVVQRLPGKPDGDPFPGFIDTTFQGRPARLFDGTYKRMTHLHLIFERDGNWYRIELSTPDPEPDGLVAAGWMKFFETFRVETPGKAPVAR